MYARGCFFPVEHPVPAGVGVHGNSHRTVGLLGEDGTQHACVLPLSHIHVSRPMEMLETSSQSLPCTYLPNLRLEAL